MKQAECDSNTLLEEIGEYGFENLEAIPEDDRSTIFYTSGRIARIIS